MYLRNHTRIEEKKDRDMIRASNIEPCAVVWAVADSWSLESMVFVLSRLEQPRSPVGSPVLSNPISSYRSGLAAAPYRDPASVPGASSPDWKSYLASVNANADWYGSPSFFAQSYVAAYQDELKQKSFSYRSMYTLSFLTLAKPCRFFAATGKCSSEDKCTL